MRAAALAALVVGILGLGGCGKKPGEKAAPPPPEVVAVHPEVRELSEVEEITGWTKAVHTVELRARVTGYLVDAPRAKNGTPPAEGRIAYTEGGDVPEGAVLFRIDPRPYQAEADKANAAVRQASATLERITGDLRRARAAGIATSREELERLMASRDEADASLSAAKAVQKTAALNLEYTSVKAPFAGRLSRSFIDPGNLVKADDTVLTSLVSLDPMHAYFDVDERTVLRVRRMIQEKQIDSARSTDLRVQIGLADDRDRYPLEGVVDFIDNQIDPGTGTLRVRAKVENPLGKDGRTRLLSPGLFVRVRLPIGKKAPTLVVPEKALGSDQGGRFVYVVTDIQRVTRKMKTTGKDGHEEVAEVEVEQGTAEYRKVQVGPPAEGGGEEGSSLRVIRDLPGVPPEKALTARSRIIVEGQQRVRRGQPVLLMPARKAGADR